MTDHLSHNGKWNYCFYSSHPSTDHFFYLFTAVTQGNGDQYAKHTTAARFR